MSLGDRRVTQNQNLFSHMIASGAARTLLAPLDVLAVRAQIGIVNPRKQQGYRKVARQMIASEGWKSLWKGNGASCLKVLPYTGVQSATLGAARVMLSKGHSRLTASQAVLAEAFATTVAASASYPMDVVKTRLMAQNSSKPAYRGIVHSLKTVTQQEGGKVLFRGLLTSLISKIPHVVALGLTTEALNRSIERPLYGLMMSPSEVLLRATVNSCVALGCTHPFDTVLKKLQAQSNVLPNNGGVPEEQKFTNARSCCSAIVKNQGIFGLWRGFVPALCRMSLFNGAVFLGFGACKQACIQYNAVRYPVEPLDDDMDDEMSKMFGLEESKKVDPQHPATGTAV